MNILEKIDNYLNEGSTVTVQSMKGDKKTGTKKVKVGDNVNVFSNAKTVKGASNSWMRDNGKIAEIKGDLVKLTAGGNEDEEYWFKSKDLYWVE